MPDPSNLVLALQLAERGWHILPLSPASKRPLGNCPACTENDGMPAHRPEECPCLPAGRWCHGVRAATASPDVITGWWSAEPRAVPAVAAGPSGLVLLDIDAHAAPLPADLATGLLPGIDLAAEPAAPGTWNDSRRYRDGRDALRLLAELRGGPAPWPADPACQPVSTVTPSGGAHLWYQAPADGLRQVLTDPEGRGRYGLAWQVDIKAGWSYGIAPGAITRKDPYAIRPGSPERPGQMPEWLARETIRTASPPARNRSAPPPGPRGDGPGPPAYLNTVINRGTARLADMTDGRRRALSALAYQVGGLLEWSGVDRDAVIGRLVDAGTTAGLAPNTSTRIVIRAIANGVCKPISPRTS